MNATELRTNQLLPEQECLTRQFAFFGPLPQELLDRVNNERGNRLLLEAAKAGELVATEDTGSRFEHWGNDLGLETKNMLSRLVNLGPMARATMDEILQDPWW